MHSQWLHITHGVVAYNLFFRWSPFRIMGSVFCGEDTGDADSRKQPVTDRSAKECAATSKQSKYTSIGQEADSEDEKEPEDEWTAKKLSVLPGECTIDRTFDLSKDLDTLRSRFPDFEDLTPREFVDVGSAHGVPSKSIKVMQFNMLADGLSNAYIWATTEKSFIGVDTECLQWTYRGLRIAEEMLRFDADVIAIEECDQMPFLMEYLGPKGYAQYFQEKKPSPTRHVAREIIAERGMEPESLSMPPDGVGIIFKTDRVSVSDEGQIERIASDQNDQKVTALAVPLRIDAMDKEVLFVVTHLKSTKSAKGEAIRESQIKALLGDNGLLRNPRNLPVVVCCDLNANPVQNKNGYDPLCYEALTSQDMGFQSVYRMAMGQEPQYTTFKKRAHGEDKHCIDYIFVDRDGWNVTKYLDIPDGGLIPSWSYPSDHFSLCAEMTWD